MKSHPSISILLGLLLTTVNFGSDNHRETPTAALAITGIAEGSGEILFAQQEGCRECPKSGDTLGDAIDPLIPYIISPRTTLLLNAQPTLRWNAVPGATNYKVSILTEEDIIWEMQVKETQVVYPGEPPLKPGVNYSIIVVTDSGVSSQQEDKPKGFRMLNTRDAEYAITAVELLEKQRLNEEDKALVQAYLYIGYYLRAEAIETLEKLVEAGNQNPDVYRLLGDVYWQVGLTPLVEKSYTKAIELYEAKGDTERVRELKERQEELKR